MRETYVGGLANQPNNLVLQAVWLLRFHDAVQPICVTNLRKCKMKRPHYDQCSMPHARRLCSGEIMHSPHRRVTVKVVWIKLTR